MTASRACKVAMPASETSMKSRRPFVKPRRNAVTAAGFSFGNCSPMLVALPYRFTPRFGRGSTTSSSACTLRASMCSSEANEKPGIAGTG